MNAAEMERTLQGISEMLAVIYPREEQWRVTEMTLMGPAMVQDIETLSRACPFPLPPSYVQFLTLHNGCLNFWPKHALMGTVGEPREIVLGGIEDARTYMDERIMQLYGELNRDRVAEYEVPTRNMERLYLPNHTVFAANRRGDFLMFNEEQKTVAGEYEVVEYSYDASVDARHRDFPCFLLAIAQTLNERIKMKGYQSAGPI